MPNQASPCCSSVRLELFSCCVCHVLVVMKANCGRCQLRGRFDGPALLAAVKTSIQVCTFIAVCLVHGRALASAVSSLRFLDRCCEVRIYVIEHIDMTRSCTSIEPLLICIGTVFHLCRFQCSRLITACVLPLCGSFLFLHADFCGHGSLTDRSCWIERI